MTLTTAGLAVNPFRHNLQIYLLPRQHMCENGTSGAVFD